MKISKPAAVIAAGLVVIFAVTMLYLYNRSLSQIEAAMAGELKQKAEAKAKAAFDKERQAFEEKQAEWMKDAAHAGEAYSKKTVEAEKNRQAAEAARRANASLNASWEVKYGKLDTIYKATLVDWKVSDEARDAAHAAEVNRLCDVVDLANGRIQELNWRIEGKFDDAGALVEPGYIQQTATLRAQLALEKKKGRRKFLNGLVIGGVAGLGFAIKF